MKSKSIGLYRVSCVREGSTPAPDSLAEYPERVAELFRSAIPPDDDREHFVVFAMSASNRVRGIMEISTGTLTASLVHPREVFRPAILLGAAGIVVAHNHPSGDLRPSPEDRETTKRLRTAGNILGVPVLDHIIVSSDSFISFRERGLMEETIP